MTTKKYAVYKQYGLTYDKEKDRFFYDGKMVRFFRDITDAAGTINGFSYNDGVVDPQGVRDASYKLIGLKKVSQKKFDEKTAELMDTLQTGNGLKLGEGECFESGDPDARGKVLEDYSAYSIIYDKASDMWKYRDKNIHTLSDGDNMNYVNGAAEDGINLEVIRGTNKEIKKLQAR